MAYTENATSVVDSGVTLGDVDNANLSSATVTMTTNYVNGQDSLAFTSQNGITGTWTASTGMLALSGTSSVGNYQAALRSITYTNSSHNPSTAARTVTFVVNDGAAASTVASRAIAVTAVNDAPVNSVPGAQTTPRNTARYFSAANGNLVSISDADAGSSNVQVQFVSTNGTARLNSTSGLTCTGNGTATLTCTGTIANINTRLTGLRFTPTTNFYGAASLRLTTSDQGFTGSGGTKTDTDTINITVT
jgi:hypothetical protein